MLTAAAIGTLASCTSSSHDDELQSNLEMKFEARQSSRASLVTKTNITDNDFSVFGDMVKSATPTATPRIVFDATEVSYTDGQWKYANTEYWFPDYTYSFVALYPAYNQDDENSNVTNLTYENNRLAFTYTQPADYKQATDILTATHRRRYQAGNPHSVAFNFDHTMARLNFTAIVDQTIAAGMVIDRFSLTNIRTQATYEITPAALGTLTETDDYVGGSWTLTDQKGTLFDITPNVTIEKAESHNFFPADSDPLIIIPQAVPNDMVVEISYHRANSSTIITATASLFNVAIGAHGGVWQPGKSYSYSFTLGATEYIVFNAPTVQSWNEAEGGNYVIID